MLEELSADNDQSAETRAEASGIVRQLRAVETAILLEVWHTIMDRFDKNKSAATKGWFVNTAVQLLESLLKFVEDLRPRFEEFEQRGIEKCGHSEYKADQQRVRKRNKLHWRALVFQVTSNKELSKKYSGTKLFMLIGTFEYAA